MEVVHTLWRPAGSGPLPTVFAIHGHGAHAQDLLGLAPVLAGGQVQFICPQADFPLQAGTLSYTWFESSGGDLRRTPDEFERVATLLEGFIDGATERYQADPARSVVLGFSQGGGLAYRLGLARPRRFAGVAALSTWLPDEAVDAADREHLAALPVLVQHGTADPLVSIERGRQSRERLVELGIDPEYREYPMQHQISNDSLVDLSTWIERVLGLSG
ncbi:MAG: alpha/beta hydrolase-fold protein [Chloroflexi bacterium]|nr:alpha/beta hydrolase-fold protein [Chloroflexota bacterium]